MLKGKISINLPSAETERKMTLVERVRAFCGAKINLASGSEELTVSAMAIVSSLISGFSDAGITNAITFIVDKKVIFNDLHETEDDLHLICEAAQRSEILENPFREMHLVLTHRENGIHSIFDVQIRNGALLGDDEMIVMATGRLEELRAQTGETAEVYANRIKEFMKDETRIESMRMIYQQLLDRIGAALRKTFIGSRVTTDQPFVCIIQPGKEQIGEYDNLRFGKDVENTHFRPVPTHHRSGAYADPFFYYYYDPYYSFTNFILLDSMLHHHHWNNSNVHVYGANGNVLYTGEDATQYSDQNWGADAVSFSSDGDIDVDRTAIGIGSSAVSDSSFAGSESNDWSGSSWSSSDSSVNNSDSSSCASSSGGDAGSSCSSCGSSCSSCGGGCGGGCSS